MIYDICRIKKRAKKGRCPIAPPKRPTRKHARFTYDYRKPVNTTLKTVNPAK